MSLELLQIHRSRSVKESLQHIEDNNLEFIFIVDDKGGVAGVVTDGDILRSMLNGVTIDDPVVSCLNTDFVWALKGSSKEHLLKQLDGKIRYVPILDADRRLVGLVTKDSLLHHQEERTYSRCIAPVRISFGGGGSDLTHFFSSSRGAVINTTISLYSRATLKIREDKKVIINSLDLGEILEADDLRTALARAGRFGLIQAALKVINPSFGFELFLKSDFPVGSGLGGSASVTCAILGCFNEFRRDKWDSYQLAEIAFQAERFILGISGGWQDQYATVFGGLNFIEFSKEQNVIHPLRIDQDTLLELQESLVLCNTGLSHESGKIHDDQRQTMQKENIRANVRRNVELTYEMKNNLLRGKLPELGKNLDQAWQLKKSFSTKISSTEIDDLYEFAKNNGALGGKLLGAGGGGFFLFYVPPFQKNILLEALASRGLKSQVLKFTGEGLQSWSARQLD